MDSVLLGSGVEASSCDGLRRRVDWPAEDDGEGFLVER